MTRFFRWWPFLGLLLIFVTYLLTFPMTVQGGDTGELVANSFFLRVSHPPGYPLFHLLYHLPVRYLSFSTAFGRASLLTLLISLGWMTLVARHFRSGLQILMLMAMATGLVFWRYSILPDVFALHLFFLSLLFIIFIRPRLLERASVIALMALAVAHHHTIAFGFPLYLYALLRVKRKRAWVLSLVFGLLAFGLYFLLLFFHPLDFSSWFELRSATDVLNHFLRKEYGTFHLAVNKVNDTVAAMDFGLQELATSYWSVLLVFCFALWRGVKTKTLAWRQPVLLAFCLLAYVSVFLGLGSIPLDLTGQEVFSRFLLQGLLWFFFLTLLLTRNVKLPGFLAALVGANVLLNLWSHGNANNFQKNTLIEDAAINNLKSLPEKSVYAAMGDTEGYSTYYVRDVLGVRPDVILTHADGDFGWSGQKLEKFYPDAYQGNGAHILDRINLEKFAFFTNFAYTVVPAYVQVTRYGLIYRYQKVPLAHPPVRFECGVGEGYQWRYHPVLADFAHFNHGYLLSLRNGECYFNQGLQALAAGDKEGALAAFNRSLEIAPFSVKVLERKCRVLELIHDTTLTSCNKTFEELVNVESKQYFLHTF